MTETSGIFPGTFRLIDRFVLVEHKHYCLLINTFYPRNRYLLPTFLKPLLEYFVSPRRYQEVSAFVREHYGQLRGGREQIITKLIPELTQLKFLVPLEFNEWRCLDDLRREKEENARISTLYIVPTLTCNLSCSYCFILQNHPPAAGQVNWNTITSAVDLFFQQYVEAPKKLCEPVIHFYGGEPLVYRKLVARTAQYIYDSKKRHGIGKVKLILNTNGTLLDWEAVDMAARYGMRVAVSLDGTPEQTTANRQYLGGGIELITKRVLRGIQLLEEANVPYGISMTLWRHNQDYEKGLEWLAANVKTRDLGINFYHPSLTDTGQPHVHDMYTQEFMRRLILETRRLGFRFMQLAVDQSLFDRCLPNLQACPASTGQMVVHPNGYVGNCHATLGTTAGFIKWEDLPCDPNMHDLWQRDRLNGPLYRSSCYLSCEYFTLCGGGCMYDAEVLYGSRYAINPTYCNFTKASVQVFAEELIERHITNVHGEPC